MKEKERGKGEKTSGQTKISLGVITKRTVQAEASLLENSNTASHTVTRYLITGKIAIRDWLAGRT